MNIIQLLKRDHNVVKKMFEEFAGLSGSRAAQKKPALVEQIHHALSIHYKVEGELVYPTFKEHSSMRDLVAEAEEEHHVAKMLLAELKELQSTDEHYDAKVKVMGEYIAHHIKEEEKELLSQAQKRFSAKRLETLGEEAEKRCSELRGEGADMEAEKEGETRRDRADKELKETNMRDSNKRRKPSVRHAA